MILGTLHILLIVGLVVLLVMLFLSPFESMRWWAGWSDDQVASAAPAKEPAAAADAQGDERYIVWLSGIGSIPGQTEDPFEVRFLSELRKRVPNAVIVDDAFAYSVRDNPLAGKRLLDRVWRTAHSDQAAGKANLLLGTTIQLRNTMQVAVSADGRYGPIYNLGLAEAIGKRLTAHGYPLDSGKPVVLIGYSGGGQVAVGSARFLKAWLHAPITVISIGGVISADPGLKAVDHLYHLQGGKDPIPGVGSAFFVGRWPLVKYSHWNQAASAGKVTTIPTGPMGHMAEPGYFGAGHLDKTVMIVADLVNGVAE
ncbi:MAG TPA: hypothetical protein VFG86_00325 [Chloroflexota bacterium]|nr:hypothetical protein [Chloroflexota bacterium]